MAARPKWPQRRLSKFRTAAQAQKRTCVQRCKAQDSDAGLRWRPALAQCLVHRRSRSSLGLVIISKDGALHTCVRLSVRLCGPNIVSDRDLYSEQILRTVSCSLLPIESRKNNVTRKNSTTRRRPLTERKARQKKALKSEL